MLQTSQSKSQTVFSITDYEQASSAICGPLAGLLDFLMWLFVEAMHIAISSLPYFSLIKSKLKVTSLIFA